MGEEQYQGAGPVHYQTSLDFLKIPSHYFNFFSNSAVSKSHFWHNIRLPFLNKWSSNEH